MFWQVLSTAKGEFKDHISASSCIKSRNNRGKLSSRLKFGAINLGLFGDVDTFASNHNGGFHNDRLSSVKTF